MYDGFVWWWVTLLRASRRRNEGQRETSRSRDEKRSSRRTRSPRNQRSSRRRSRSSDCGSRRATRSPEDDRRKAGKQRTPHSPIEEEKPPEKESREPLKPVNWADSFHEEMDYGAKLRFDSPRSDRGDWTFHTTARECAEIFYFLTVFKCRYVLF